MWSVITRIRYYDERVPADYEPELFHSPLSEEAVLKYKDIPAEVNVGRVETGHHTLEVKVKTTIGN